MGRIESGFNVGDSKYHCEYCGKTKSINEFPKDKDKELGFKTKCKECYNEYLRNYNRDKKSNGQKKIKF